MALAIPIDLSWSPLDTAAICTLQTLGAAGSLTIDGPLSYWPRPDVRSKYASFGNVRRVVSLTSANNLAGVSFTITGYFNGLPVTETRVGPNSNTVETTQIYEIVTSISTNGAVTAVSVGSGSTGQTAYLKLPGGRFFILATVINGTGAITYEGRETNNPESDVANFNSTSIYQRFLNSGAVSSNSTTVGQLFSWYVITASTGTAQLNIHTGANAQTGGNI